MEDMNSLLLHPPILSLWGEVKLSSHGESSENIRGLFLVFILSLVFLWMQALVHLQGETSGSGGPLAGTAPDQLLAGSHTSFSCRLHLMFQACVTQRENNAEISFNQLK